MIPVCPTWLLGVEFFAGVVVGASMTMLVRRSRK